MSIKLLHLPSDAEAILVARPNRFVGIVNILDQKSESVISESVKVHIHDPGRLNEILYPGNHVFLKKPNLNSLVIRKTKWDIIAGLVNDQSVLIHSGYHRKLAEMIFKNKKINPFGTLINIQPEVRFGNSRLDFLLTSGSGEKIFVEIKGCTLTVNNRALFPDAPSSRATRHLKELMVALKKGYRAAVIVLVFRSDSICFAPNFETDPNFTKAFTNAVVSGVEVFPLVLSYRNEFIYYEKRIPVCNDY